MLTQAQLAQRICHHVRRELYDESGVAATGTAICSLADPRDLRTSRYVGQTTLPVRRFKQHLTTARLWMPQQTPWWMAQPMLRPLYEWVRELYNDGERLPTMVVHTWVDGIRAARAAERARIHESLAKKLPLLNFEAELLGRQMSLL